MKKKSKRPKGDELRSEYDASLIRSGEQGKYAAEYQGGTNLVLLAPDVAEAFPDTKSVNDALRMLLRVARTAVAT